VGNPQSPLSSQVIRVEINGGGQSIVTDPAWDHSATFNSTMDYFFDSMSRVDAPPRIVLRDASGNQVRVISDPPDDSLAYLAGSPPRFHQVPTRDGGLMDGMLILPADFDPASKYPVIVHVYSGPQSPTVRNQFRGPTYLWHRLMAQQGFAIWMCDNRSSSHRSHAPAWETYGNLGERELADILDGLDWLIANHAWVDSSRIGIWGWSYGGYMTAYAMTHCDRFAAGVAGAPVTDWRNYDAIYTERLMKRPQENADGYDRSSVVRAADQLSGRLLLVHGTIDDNVHMANTLQLAEALQNAGKPFEMMLYPQNRHAITQPAQRAHCWQTIADFFVRSL
jgi:dipeptidyl-peptidase-4